jgi:hypothetical protein
VIDSPVTKKLAPTRTVVSANLQNNDESVRLVMRVTKNPPHTPLNPQRLDHPATLARI